MSCLHALHFLQSLPNHSWLQIKSISLLDYLIVADNYSNYDYTKELYRFLVNTIALETITLAILDNIAARIEEYNED